MAKRAAAESTTMATNDDDYSSTSTDFDVGSSLPSVAITTSISASLPSVAPFLAVDSSVIGPPSSSSITESTTHQMQADKTWTPAVNTITLTGSLSHTNSLSTGKTPTTGLPSSTSSTPVPTMTSIMPASMLVSSSTRSSLVLSSSSATSGTALSSSSLDVTATTSTMSPTSSPTYSSGMPTGVKAAIGGGAALAVLLVVGFLAYMIFAGRKGKMERTIELQDPPPQEEKPESSADLHAPNAPTIDDIRKKEIGVIARHGFFELAW
ncbi:uncharacterized protein PAC_10049 [Phialocephala subalpina]|uniref:Mid2 domain-containing protein n=1 Tax=Phialocephala subalpina TaxID=576137 RepID=A0A1L7X552_9HELO|nr:uncharacterized protein PAC_10049 [Phialocephala subalpina]